jgi:3-isopropylmalate dehydrogenase
MLLRHTFQLEREAACIEDAVGSVLTEGWRTADLVGKTQTAISTAEMGRRVLDAVKSSVISASEKKEKSA